ncbi:MAG: hypothetical protein JNK75_11900 [Betaproteobacteria bacterium]|nr:hypothetical protein [Betaproteobacteria bacterium]
MAAREVLLEVPDRKNPSTGAEFGSKVARMPRQSWSLLIVSSPRQLVPHLQAPIFGFGPAHRDCTAKRVNDDGVATTEGA